MRVVIVCNYWKGSPGGGVKNYLTHLVDALNKTGRVKTIVIFREGDDLSNLKVGVNRFLFPIHAFIKLILIRPDVMNSHGPWYCAMPCYLYKSLFRKKFVWTFHTQPARKLPLIARLFMHFLIRKCDCVTFASRALCEQIQSKEIWRPVIKKVAITYPGVAAQQVTQEDLATFRKKFGLEGRHPILLAQGLTAHILKAEGAKLLILSVKQLKEKYPNIVLILTREGVFSSKLKKLCYVEKVENVVFTGDLQNPFIPLAICDIYAHVVFGDGMPIALLEAMLMGKPIVATPVGGISEVIQNGKNGVLVVPNVEEVCKSIDYLLKSPSRMKSLGRCAKETVKEKFTWERCAKQFLELYCE